VANAVDFLNELCDPRIKPDLAEVPPISILVVDDEILSRRAIVYALEKAFLKPTSVENPEEALQIAVERFFDLIFLDVQMPNLDGFQVCERIREHPLNRNTPVVFVTSHNDFRVRAQSTLSGGSDFIAKPFMFIELTVKALAFVLRGRIQRLKQQGAL
jgi:CheY-like chemotaxis protein